MPLSADVVLGLIAKTEQVFAGDGLASDDEMFLSFPVSSVVAFPAAHLADLGRPSPSAAAAQTAADFARIVNTIPRGRLWRPAAGPTLWEVVARVLTDAEVATVIPTDAHQAAYDSAHALLYERHADGSIVESQALLTYRQHRDAWFVAQAEYANRRGLAEQAGAEELERFRAVDEPQLRAVIAEVEVAWEVSGRRSQIEAAQRAVRTLHEHSPATAWAAFLARFDPSLPDLSMYTAPDGAPYAPTGLLPATVAETPWPVIRVDRTQLDALADAADAELRQSLRGDSDRSIIEVSFEYTSVSLQRPWFSSDLFEARYWRLPAGSQQLSDGATPPQGTCPAYVAAVALARNVVVRRFLPAADATQPADLGFLGGTQLLRVAQPTPVAVRIDGATAAAARAQPEAGTRGRDATVVRDHRRGTAVRAPGGTTVHDHRGASRPAHRAPPAIARLRLNDLIVGRREPARDEPPGSRTSTEQTPSDQIYVLAFICKKLARTPNPDPRLFGSPTDGQESDLPSTPSDTEQRTHVVAPGETLAAIGGQHGIPWKKIAELNNIEPPYVIRTQQVLRLPDMQPG